MVPMYLRLSVTTRCNLRCAYCRPQEGWCGGDDRPALTDQEVLALVAAVAQAVPVAKIRLTGGEPMLRPGLCGLVAELRGLLPAVEICLTTNGTGLAEQAAALRQAGVDRLNVSFDSADPRVYEELTQGRLDGVLRGLDAARAAGFRSVRTNSVLLRTRNGDSLPDIVRLALAHGAKPRFIELMPFGPAREFHAAEYMSTAEALARLGRAFEYLGPLDASGSAGWHEFRIDGRRERVGYISPVSHPFCATCNRLRLDSWGRLYGCLRRGTMTDLAEPLRAGNAGEVARLVARLLELKRPPEGGWPERQMNAIGG
jgi:cyclic pyranopterin phosphate synthase